MKKLSPYSYFEIVVEYSAADPKLRALIGDFLSGCGIGLQEIAFCETPSKTFAAVYTRSFRILNKIRKSFKKEFGRGFRLKRRLLVREDWFDKWQQHYRIMPIGKTFTLVPLWQKDKYKPQGRREPIYLDPKGASGSGQHPTTQIMTLFLEQIRGKFTDCLDLGTGTGVLGVMAAKLGSQRVIAVDNDTVAVKAARFNLRYNQVPSFEVRSGDVTLNKKIERYELVCANLISPVLENIQDFLFASVEKEGYLAVSGVHVQNFVWFRKIFRHPKFRCLRVMKKRGWTGMLFKRVR